VFGNIELMAGILEW